ncbi:ABC transporter permease [Frigidibacter sp. MR17.14]|uniref:ABC transporter permease n=1 Tax=Frigidibacter sp. MR17.14 TaxID=3126509 RepID=UPI003012AB3A
MSQIDHPMTMAKPARASTSRILGSLIQDRPALAACAFLILLAFSATLGAALMAPQATGVNMAMRNAAPQLGEGFAYLLGGDNLGRSVLARLVTGARTTLGIATAAVLCSLTIGATLGLFVGLRQGLMSDIIMRLTDVIMSFPALLTALIVLYLLGPSPVNLVIVLAITRIPVYLRTVRAEVLELRRRPFVNAARAMGASEGWITRHHLLPLVAPTLLTIASVDFAAVIIAESGLSFLGLGIQPPNFTWGAMVAAGRPYIAQAWWVTFFPGLAIMLTTLSLTLLSNWLRLVTDPNQRWRFTRSEG